MYCSYHESEKLNLFNYEPTLLYRVFFIESLKVIGYKNLKI